MEALVYAAVFLGALSLMEGVAYFTHKYVMHGFLWVLHKSHHQQRKGWFELNDLFAFFFATPSIILIWFGTNGYPRALWAGLGVAAYGAVYFGFHDIIVHRRIHHNWRPGGKYMQRIMHAHRLHHALEEKQGAVSFGFAYARPVPVLRAQMKAIEMQRAAA
ncbi:MAG: sterol desaturase family protein [Paracoccaceae bacterium]